MRTYDEYETEFLPVIADTGGGWFSTLYANPDDEGVERGIASELDAITYANGRLKEVKA